MNEAKAFRADYARLAELRAFLPSNIPVVALTATIYCTGAPRNHQKLSDDEYTHTLKAAQTVRT